VIPECTSGFLVAIVGEEDMPDEDGAFVEGATGAGGGFMVGVVEGGRIEVVVVIPDDSRDLPCPHSISSTE